MEPVGHAGAVAARASGMRVEFVTEAGELPALAERWEALNDARSDHDAPFFQSFAWNSYVARIRLGGVRNRYRLLVATVWRDDDLIGVWPLSLQRRVGAWIACSLDDPFGPLAGVAFRRREDIGPGVTAVLQELRKRSDGLRIEAVVSGSALHAALLENKIRVVSTQGAVVVGLSEHSTFKSFEQTINSKTRKNLRNLRNRLERTHAIEHKVTDAPAQLATMLPEVLEARTRWIRRNGRMSAAFRDADFTSLVSDLARSGTFHLLGFALATSERWIAAQWGFVHAGRYYAYMSAMDPDCAEFSPGRIHLGMVIKACFERGVGALELMAPAVGYKLEWSDQVKNVDTLQLPFSIKGRMALQVVGWASAQARRLSRALPESIGKPIVNLFNRPWNPRRAN